MAKSHLGFGALLVLSTLFGPRLLAEASRSGSEMILTPSEKKTEENLLRELEKQPEQEASDPVPLPVASPSITPNAIIQDETISAAPVPEQVKNTEVMEVAQPQTPVSAARRRPGAYFGFGIGKADQIGANNFFKKLYSGNPKFVNAFAGYYLLSYFIDLGLIGKAGYFTASGHPLVSGSQALPAKNDLSSQVTLDKSQNLELTLIPLALSVDMAISPFASRRVVLRGWYGFENLYVQEVLKPDLPSSVSTSDSSQYLNKGWNTGRVAGAALSLSLNGIDSRSDYALRSLGIDKLYISPFLELVKTDQARMGNFDRQTYGIAFEFEALR